MEQVAKISEPDVTDGTTFHVGFYINTPKSGISFFFVVDELNIPLRLNVRYSENVLAYSSYENGAWRDEVRLSGFPFDVGLNTLEAEISDGVITLHANGLSRYVFLNGKAVSITKLVITKNNSGIDHEVKYVSLTSSIYDVCGNKTTSGLSNLNINTALMFVLVYAIFLL